MAQRRAITTHPVFVPLVASWFAALFGLGIAVLPAPVMANALGTLGLGGLGSLAASVLAAAVGAVLGLSLAMALARRSARDPRPIYAETDAPSEFPIADGPVRRPLRVHEEVAEGRIDAVHGDRNPNEIQANGAPSLQFVTADADADADANADPGFMILAPPPVRPPRPAHDFDGLVAQFDAALAAFRSPEDERPATRSGEQDPVHAFVARQTRAPAPSPFGGRMPDHQAELRAALDKLAQARRKD